MPIEISQLYSPVHQQRYQQYYATTGTSLKPHKWQWAVEAVAGIYQAQTILDYGAGPARKLETFSHLPIMSYDPGVPALAAAPEPADLVVCLHTLEHVEWEYLLNVLTHLEALTRKALFIVISCQESTKVLPDGTPWHTIVRPGQWWRDALAMGESMRLIWPFYLPERQDAEWVGLLEKKR